MLRGRVSLFAIAWALNVIVHLVANNPNFATRAIGDKIGATRGKLLIAVTGGDGSVRVIAVVQANDDP